MRQLTMKKEKSEGYPTSPIAWKGRCRRAKVALTRPMKENTFLCTYYSTSGKHYHKKSYLWHLNTPHRCLNKKFFHTQTLRQRWVLKSLLYNKMRSRVSVFCGRSYWARPMIQQRKPADVAAVSIGSSGWRGQQWSFLIRKDRIKYKNKESSERKVRKDAGRTGKLNAQGGGGGLSYEHTALRMTQNLNARRMWVSVQIGETLAWNFPDIISGLLRPCHSPRPSFCTWEVGAYCFVSFLFS